MKVVSIAVGLFVLLNPCTVQATEKSFRNSVDRLLLSGRRQLEGASAVAPLSPLPTSAPTSAPTGPRDEEIEKLRADYIENRALWTNLGIETYSFYQQFFPLAYPPPWNDFIDVEVKDGVLLSRVFSDGTNIEDADSPLDLSEFVLPINELFDFIDGIIDGSIEVSVSYNTTFHYPTYVYAKVFSDAEPIIFSVGGLVPIPVQTWAVAWTIVSLL